MPRQGSSFFIARIRTGWEEGRLVAVRHLPSPVDAAQAAAIRDAVQRARGIRGPSVIAVLDLIEASGALVLISEYLEGDSLRSLLQATSRGQPLPAPIALRIALDATEALASTKASLRLTGAPGTALESARLPESFMVAAFGDTMMTDVGLVQLCADRPLDLCAGNAGPMSPAALEGGASDPRNEVRAIGALLWEMLAGAPLRKQDREPEPIPPLETIARAGPRISPRVAKLVARAVATDPAERFEDLDALASAIRDLGSGALATVEQVPSVVERVLGARHDARQLGAGGSSLPGSDRGERASNSSDATHRRSPPDGSSPPQANAPRSAATPCGPSLPELTRTYSLEKARPWAPGLRSNSAPSARAALSAEREDAPAPPTRRPMVWTGDALPGAPDADLGVPPARRLGSQLVLIVGVVVVGAMVAFMAARHLASGPRDVTRADPPGEHEPASLPPNPSTAPPTSLGSADVTAVAPSGSVDPPAPGPSTSAGAPSGTPAKQEGKAGPYRPRGI